MRLVYFVLGLFLFVTALGLMKAGAQALVPTLEGSIFTDNAWSTLGLGWLGACIVLSGSPVAASALTLLDGGAIDQHQAFTMLTGSRLGAAFVVLVVGAIYAARGAAPPGRRAPISIGILSLLMTMVVYVPGAVVGYILLERGTFDGLTFGTSPELTSADRHAVRLVGRPAEGHPAGVDAVPDRPGGAAARVLHVRPGAARRQQRPARAPGRGLVHAEVADVPGSAAASAC